MEGAAGSSTGELQKLLEDGMAAIAGGTAVEKIQKDEVDITQDFFKECGRLKLGELAMCDSFQLSEAMSAIELMDPKMDIGMVAFDGSICFENLVESGRLNVDDMEGREMIATMDAMFSSLISWLDGNSLAQTLLTCVCLHDPGLIKDSVLSSFCYGMLDLVTTVRHIIQTAAVYEEEDFNGYCFDLKTIPTPQVLNFLKTAENDLQKKMRQKPSNSQFLDALQSRISFLRLLIASLVALTPPPILNATASTVFRPNLEEAGAHIRAASVALEKVASSVSLGLEPKGSVDGDFGWLPAFEPDVNRRHLPPTFPRKTEMQNRVEGIQCLQRICSRILSITVELPSKIGNLESTLTYLRRFSESDSCVLSRSLLQLVYLPNDENILGRTPLASVIIETIRVFVAPPILDPSCSLSSDSQCRLFWDEFISDAVKVFLGVIQVFGQNLARQREKISCAIEDLAALQCEAERVESAFDLFLEGQEPAVGLSLTSFVLYHTLLLIEHHFHLSFRLDLFSPFEYPYVYWYLSEIVFKWMLNTIDRSHNLLLADFRRSTSKDKRKADRKKLLKSKKEMETQLRKRMSEKQCSLLFHKAQAYLCDGLFKTSVGLISAGKIRLPSVGTISERQRFDHRMLPFSSLSPPLLLSYDQFVESSRIDALSAMGSQVCFTQAADAFESARSLLEKFDGIEELFTEAGGIARICKQNAVVSRILSSGSKSDCSINFVYGEFSMMYPLLKIS